MKITGTSSTYSVTFGDPTSWWNLDLNRDATRVTSVTGVARLQSGFKWNSGEIGRAHV